MDGIDLRSDTVTRPSEKMRQAMADAVVGDDVYGEDPTVSRLERAAAELLGMESALFASSGTQTNLLALLSHCERGDEYIAGQMAHTYKFEGGGAAILGSIQPQPIENEPDGTLDLEKVSKVIKPLDFHFARTRLLCLENTINGMVLPLEYLRRTDDFCRQHELKLHLDGARVFNASVKQKVPVTEISKCFDSVSVCLSKGLGAPVGSVLCASEDVIAKARRWRKVVGGGMRQAGAIAAPALIALTENVARLQEDHDNAQLLADGLSQIEELKIDQSLVQTNMVFVEVEQERFVPLRKHLEENGILTLKMNPMRLVTHLDISQEDIHRTVAAFEAFFANRLMPERCRSSL